MRLESGHREISENRESVESVEAKAELPKRPLEKTEAPREVPEAERISNGELPAPGRKLEGMTAESVEAGNEAVERHFEEFQRKRWESPEVRERKREIVSDSLALGGEAYEAAGEIAREDAHLSRFSDHTDKRHVKQVIEKTLTERDRMEKLAREHPERWGDTLSDRTSENTLIFAAALHDTGMAGEIAGGEDPVERYERRREALAAEAKAEGEAPDPERAGAEIRKGHSCESAMFVLSRREQAEAMNEKIEAAAREGETPDKIDVDEAAMIVALHSKTARMGSEGVRVQDLSDREQMLRYAEQMKAVAAERGLEFRDDFLYRTDEAGARVPDEEALRRVATEAAALRLGDSYRPSSEVQITQGGEAMFIDATRVKPEARSLSEEMEGVRVGFFDEAGEEIPEKRLELGDHPEQEISKAYAVGEKNVADFTTGEVDESGDMRVDIELRDGNSCPHATSFVIGERVREAAGVDGDKLGSMVFRIHSRVEMDSEHREKLARLLETDADVACEKRAERPGDDGELVTDRSEEQRQNRIRIEFVD